MTWLWVVAGAWTFALGFAAGAYYMVRVVERGVDRWLEEK